MFEIIAINNFSENILIGIFFFLYVFLLFQGFDGFFIRIFHGKKERSRFSNIFSLLLKSKEVKSNDFEKINSQLFLRLFLIIILSMVLFFKMPLLKEASIFYTNRFTYIEFVVLNVIIAFMLLLVSMRQSRYFEMVNTKNYCENEVVFNMVLILVLVINAIASTTNDINEMNTFAIDEMFLYRAVSLVGMLILLVIQKDRLLSIYGNEVKGSISANEKLGGVRFLMAYDFILRTRYLVLCILFISMFLNQESIPVASDLIEIATNILVFSIKFCGLLFTINVVLLLIPDVKIDKKNIFVGKLVLPLLVFNLLLLVFIKV